MWPPALPIPLPSLPLCSPIPRGTVNSSHVVEQEAGFLYRYRYNGRGAAASFVGQYNFVVIDVSAGPVSFGPLASPGGAVAPAGMPRLLVRREGGGGRGRDRGRRGVGGRGLRGRGSW